MRTIESGITRYSLRDDGIVAAVGISPETVRDGTNMAESLDALQRLVGDTPRPVLWDPRAVQRFQPEAWMELISRTPSLIVAVAILTDDATDERLGGYPETIDSRLFPMRRFRSEEAALTWLSQYLN
jgi:hypothetical protein